MCKEQIENELMQFVNHKDNNVFDAYIIDEIQIEDFSKIIIMQKASEAKLLKNAAESIDSFNQIIGNENNIE